jgi:uncharacterized protein (DUF58 family)
VIPAEVMQQIQRIHIRTRRTVNDLLAGQYESVFKGQGMVFHDVRAYVPGDDVRSIDWNVTARTGQPHVKVMVEEREQTVMLVVDASASKQFGSRTRLKSELAAELCAVLAYSAIKNQDKVGLLVFSDRVERFVRPQKGRKHVLRVIREILFFEPEGRGTNVSAALDYLNQVLPRHAIVFLVSDFMGAPFEASLRVTARKHDTIAVAVNDPREFELPDVGVIALRDAESGREVLADTGSRRLREAYAEQAWRRRSERTALMKRVRVDLIELRTDASYVDALHRFFRMRERRMLA